MNTTMRRERQIVVTGADKHEGAGLLAPCPGTNSKFYPLHSMENKDIGQCQLCRNDGEVHLLPHRSRLVFRDFSWIGSKCTMYTLLLYMIYELRYYHEDQNASSARFLATASTKFGDR